jgi:hypothetical protein
MGTLKDWVKERVDAKDFTIDEIATHSCVAGFPYLTYYHDTNLLYDKYTDDIWNLVNDSADQCGKTPMQFIAGWSQLAMNSDASFKNNLVWFAVEEICYQLGTEEDQLRQAAGE